MSAITTTLLIFHILGLSLIIGPFFLQISRKKGFAFGTMLIGAITQLVTGLAMVGVLQAGDGDVNNSKIAVKTVIAVLVLVAVIVARSRQGKAVTAGTSEKVALPWLHIAGAGAVANVIIAVLWH
tara:strand:- start:21075 stop:21449 length:375 start_codon:yes stop_codon:yes gene_type:complete